MSENTQILSKLSNLLNINNHYCSKLIKPFLFPYKIPACTLAITLCPLLILNKIFIYFMTNKKLFSDFPGTSLARYAPMVSEQNPTYPYATGVGVVICRLIMSSYLLSKVQKERVGTGKQLEYFDRTDTSFFSFLQERIIFISCPGNYFHLAEPKQRLLDNSRYRFKNIITIAWLVPNFWM